MKHFTKISVSLFLSIFLIVASISTALATESGDMREFSLEEILLSDFAISAEEVVELPKPQEADAIIEPEQMTDEPVNESIWQRVAFYDLHGYELFYFDVPQGEVLSMPEHTPEVESLLFQFWYDASCDEVFPHNFDYPIWHDLALVPYYEYCVAQSSEPEQTEEAEEIIVESILSIAGDSALLPEVSLVPGSDEAAGDVMQMASSILIVSNDSHDGAVDADAFQDDSDISIIEETRQQTSLLTAEEKEAALRALFPAGFEPQAIATEAAEAAADQPESIPAVEADMEETTDDGFIVDTEINEASVEAIPETKPSTSLIPYDNAMEILLTMLDVETRLEAAQAEDTQTEEINDEESGEAEDTDDLHANVFAALLAKKDEDTLVADEIIAEDDITLEDEAIAEESNATEDNAAEENPASQPDVDPCVTIDFDITDDSMITAVADLENFPKDCSLVFQWQNDASGCFEDVPGANDKLFTFSAEPQLIQCQWRVNVSVLEA